MSGHSPLPWTIRKAFYGWMVNAESAGDVAEVFSLTDTQANAEFIVRACNSHDDLLAALKELVDAVTPEVNEKGAGGYLLARLTDARAAIAKAEGR